eukprot:RCo040108
MDPETGKPSDMSLKALLEASQSQLPQSERVPIKRDLRGLAEYTAKLFPSKSGIRRDDHEEKIDIILASRGFDSEKHRRTLQSIANSRLFADLPEGEHPTSLDSFLRQRHSMLLLSALEEARAKTQQLHDDMFTAAANSEWQRSKLDLELALGQRRGDVPLSTVGQSLVQLPTEGLHQLSSVAPRQLPALDGRTQAYAEQVLKLSAAYKANPASRGVPVGFGQAIAAVDDLSERKAMVLECWEILRCILDSVDSSSLAEVPSSSRGFAQDLSQGRGSSVQLAVLRGARQFLERQYEGHIQSTLGASQAGATLAQKQRMIVMFSKKVVDSTSLATSSPSVMHSGLGEAFVVWPCLYYALRCGLLEAAEQFAEEARD